MRLTSEGSASTWPKSGLTVRSRVMLLVMPNLASSPALHFHVLPVANGFPSSVSKDSRLPTTNGVMSACFLGLMPVRPVSSPKLCTRPEALRSTCCQIDISWLRNNWRNTSRPHMPSSVILNLNCVRGILISALQPQSFICVSVYQIGSHVSSSICPFWTHIKSFFTPAALVRKVKPV